MGSSMMMLFLIHADYWTFNAAHMSLTWDSCYCNYIDSDIHTIYTMGDVFNHQALQMFRYKY